MKIFVIAYLHLLLLSFVVVLILNVPHVSLVSVAEEDYLHYCLRDFHRYLMSSLELAFVKYSSAYRP